MNGAHMCRRKGIGDTKEEGLGDGLDLLSEPERNFRRVVEVVVGDGFELTVLTETHMNKAQLKAAIGYLKRVHGLSAFGTVGKYSTESRHTTAGVLVVWDPKAYMCEDSEVILASRIVRLSMRSLADGRAIHLVAAYMPTRQSSKEVVDEAWELFDAEATHPSFVGAGDLNVEVGADNTPADRWFNAMLRERHLSSLHADLVTYKKGEVESKLDHWLVGGELADAITSAGLGTKAQGQ